MVMKLQNSIHNKLFLIKFTLGECRPAFKNPKNNISLYPDYALITQDLLLNT